MMTKNEYIAKTLLSQINTVTLYGNGFKGYSVKERGADLLFQLARPYGKRRISIVLNYGDLYDVTVYRYGKHLKETKVTEYNDIYFDQLSETIWDGIEKSCEN